MQINKFSEYKLVNAFIGGMDDLVTGTIAFDRICEHENITHVDFLKVDIEGAEFELFKQLPFEKIERMTIEVHPEHGNPTELVNKLRSHSFRTITCDSAFRLTEVPERIDYIYAQRINT
jgi:hypothetical protein